MSSDRQKLLQRTGGIVFALAVGISLAWMAYQSKPTPEELEQRALEESMVLTARAEIRRLLGDKPSLQIADPLQPNRVAGKVFVYPVDGGFQVSGHYRRSKSLWYPWLVTLDAAGRLVDASAAGPEGPVDLLAADDP